MTTTTVSLYSRIRPASIWLEIPLLAAFNLILVASAYLAIPLPFSPVPITGQTFAVMLIGMVLGRRRGAAVVLAYLVEGACGLPVFASGAMGIPALLGPTGGYLGGFVVAAWVTGFLSEHGWDRSYVLSSLAMLIGHAVVFAAGLAWLYRYVPAGQVIALGLTPFVVGTIIKVVAAAGLLPTVWKFIGKQSESGSR
jgi:biotin transport system substrate-specific component